MCDRELDGRWGSFRVATEKTVISGGLGKLREPSRRQLASYLIAFSPEAREELFGFNTGQQSEAMAE
ncbi:hypothetical protein BOSEA31B_20586 [Hyphomicrobiales bacterium]|nr:hypothetical protein BOSEA31B_20586 [Hyphomicrobiales bacterium]CAH1702922.1 hypothetical protein BOSEA1005_30794 [Hyphomicrobiales bacterium]CAI0347108.1 hypothetical protein BO1005MUT1_530284 [Hyphomicrobiales bacterium]